MDGREINRRIIKSIKKDLSDRFRVIDNTGKDKKIVAGLFPDVLLMRPEPPKNDDVLFVMKIEKDDDLMSSIAEWREFDKLPIMLYVVVPEKKLNEAKRLANVVGVSVKFASYEINKDGALELKYE